MRRVPCFATLATFALLMVGCPSEEDGISATRPRATPTPKASSTTTTGGKDVAGGISDQGQVTPPPAGTTVTPSPTPAPTLRPLDEPGGNATPPPPTPTPSIDPTEGSLPGDQS